MENKNETTGLPNWLKLLVSWMFVGIPLVWGITMTVIKSLALFR